MKFEKKFIRFAFNIILHPEYIRIILLGLFKRRFAVKEDICHLNAAMQWLQKSQDITKTGGSSGIFTFENGWSGPYPETSGYIIPTFLEYSELSNDESYLKRAREIGDWELSIQMENGAVLGGVGINDYPIVFNTGQVIFGWTALFKKTGEKKYIDAAIKACSWLVDIQDEDGKWSKFTYNNITHAYNVRVTWALLEVAVETGNSDFKNAALKNIDWVLSQVKDKEWIEYMGFTLQENPFTHTIAYTLRGLLECGLLLDGAVKERLIKQVINSSDKILDTYADKMNIPGTRFMLPGTLDRNWSSKDSYSCLTGNVQLAIIWLKLFDITGNVLYWDSALANIDAVKSTQSLTSKNAGIKGGIPGSYPIWGGYIHFGYPNWAAKFFAEAILLKMKLKAKV